MLIQTDPRFPYTPIARIPLQRGFVTFCDPKWLFTLSTLHWYAKKSRSLWYACSKIIIAGKVKFLRMHRIVAHTPDGMIPHHLNGNTLDNREENLLNITEYEHAKYFSYW
ncbi:hypothetical protein ES703_63245 [subsurface metagenome]